MKKVTKMSQDDKENGQLQADKEHNQLQAEKSTANCRRRKSKSNGRQSEEQCQQSARRAYPTAEENQKNRKSIANNKLKRTMRSAPRRKWDR